MVNDRRRSTTDRATRPLPTGARVGVAVTGVVGAFTILGAVSFGAKSVCTASPARSCGAIDQWFLGAVVLSTFIALGGAMGGRSTRSAWVMLAAIAVVVAVASSAMLAIGD